jgi:hypothetical protein
MSLLAGCGGQPTQEPLAGHELADEVPSSECLFGADIEQWDDDPDSLVLDTSLGWSSIDFDGPLWPGAEEQIIEAIGLFEGASLEESLTQGTDDGEVDFRELSDPVTGDAYLAYRFIQGDDTFGAIFTVPGGERVGLIVQRSVEDCQVAVADSEPSCKDDGLDSPAEAALLGETGTLIESDGAFRTGRGAFAGAYDYSDWYRVDFATDNQCFSCFEPHGWVEDSATPISELCVFVSQDEIAERGPVECAAGTATKEDGLFGCCSTDLLHGPFMNTGWDHGPGEGSSMYLRVSTETPAKTCEPYDFTWGHFAG